jgi:CheY-like chemotaxis protein
MNDEGEYRTTHDRLGPAIVVCPYCGHGSPVPLGRVGSRLNWYTCGPCHKTWAARTPSSGEENPLPTDATAPATRHGPDGAGALALVADDELLIREQLAEFLGQFNYRVVLARDGLEALAQVAMYRDRLRLVTTDFNMPNMDGFALARALREQLTPDVRIVVISGLIDDEDTRTLRRIGVDAVLRKPFDRWSLARAIDRDVDG